MIAKFGEKKVFGVFVLSLYSVVVFILQSIISSNHTPYMVRFYVIWYSYIIDVGR